MTENEAISVLAGPLVVHLSQAEFEYSPRRGIGVGAVKTWPDRLRGYRWKRNDSPWEDYCELKRLEDILAPYCSQLGADIDWPDADRTRLKEATEALFKWGGVLRGKGHKDPKLEVIDRVMRTALSYRDVYQAPLDSAWTKLAAVSTARSDLPQVIFDSRVSISILGSIDSVCDQNPDLEPARRALMMGGLGFVPGRGGNRPCRVRELQGRGWKSGYGKWSAQFTASRLVNEMVNVLNINGTFGEMPMPKGGFGRWTVRGVEMVLFMDGY
jgi:hypothetical protein